MTSIFYSTWVKPACCVSKISSDGGCQSKETGVGIEVRLLSVGARGFSLAASRLAFAASPLNSVAPNKKKTSGTQGNIPIALLTTSTGKLSVRKAVTDQKSPSDHVLGSRSWITSWILNHFNYHIQIASY